MKQEPFNRSKHVYRNDAFVELVKDAVRFFNGTPVHSLPPPEKFLGTGIYAIYYIGKHRLYTKYAELNRLSYASAIYVGKAVPKGWRQSSLLRQSFVAIPRTIQPTQSTQSHHRFNLRSFP